MMDDLTNGCGQVRTAVDALPALRDELVQKVARVLCKQRGHDPDRHQPGGVCLGEVVADFRAGIRALLFFVFYNFITPVHVQFASGLGVVSFSTVPIWDLESHPHHVV